MRQTPELREAVYSLINRDVERALSGLESVKPSQVPRQEGAWAPEHSVTEFSHSQEAKLAEAQQKAMLKGEAFPDIPMTLYEAIVRDYTGRTWGTSLGGGHVFSAAAQDQRVKCIVSQLAFADGEVLVTGEMNELEKASFLPTLNKMAEKKKNTGKEMFVGVTRVLSDNESKVFFEKVKGQYPEMDIKIPFLTVMETLQYKPAESAAKVQCPVLVVIAGQDSVNPPEQGRALYDAVASGTKELYEEADACHYDIYKGAFFERVAAVQTQWFKKHL